MNIAFVIPSMLRGGAERAMSILCNEFARKGDVVFLYLTEIADNVEYPLVDDVNLVDLTVNLEPYIRKIPIFIKKIKKRIKEDNIDVVVSFITRTNIYSIIACKLAAVPIIVSERNNPYLIPGNSKLRTLRNFLYKYADGIVFQTSYAQNYYCGKISGKSSIIMNPITAYKKDLIPIKGRDNIIITACRLEPQKNVALLIKAFAKISSQIPDYNLHIYGRGSLRRDLENLINSFQLGGRVFLMGVDENVIDKVANAKIFVLSSDFEGLSNSLAEALSVGTACIATDSPTYGNRNLIVDGKSGFIVPVGEIDMLAEKILELVTNANQYLIP